MRSRKHAKKRRLVLLASGVAEITMAFGAFAQSPPFEPPTKHLFAASYANEWPLLSASEYEPRSRDALFGGAPAKEESPPAKVNGFIDGLAAYTYSGPAHWSRAVARVPDLGDLHELQLGLCAGAVGRGLSSTPAHAFAIATAICRTLRM